MPLVHYCVELPVSDTSQMSNRFSEHGFLPPGLAPPKAPVQMTLAGRTPFSPRCGEAGSLTCVQHWTLCSEILHLREMRKCKPLRQKPNWCVSDSWGTSVDGVNAWEKTGNMFRDVMGSRSCRAGICIGFLLYFEWLEKSFKWTWVLDIHLVLPNQINVKLFHAAR